MLVRDKVVIVSGIGPGLGVKLAVHAALEGARGVVITSRTAERLDEAEALVLAANADCGVVKHVVDICEQDQCRAAAEAGLARFGRLDALVNNAYAHPDFDGVAEADLDRFVLPFKTNVIGTLKMTQAVLPAMKAQGGGSVVMINTMGAKMVPIVAEASYCASKEALANATRNLAAEVGKHQIRVNGIHMGFMWGVPVQSYMAANPQDFGGSVEQGYADVAQHHALRRIVTDDECARAALFLASDYSSAMTGTAIDCNGGWYMP